MDDKSNAVYTIDASLISADISTVTYIDKNPFYEMYDQLKTVDITFEGETHEMKFVFNSGEGDSAENSEEISEERYFNGQFVRNDEYDADYNSPEDKFNHLLAALYAIEISDIEPIAPETKGELLLKVVYNRIDGTSNVIECYKRDNTTCYVYENNEYIGGYMRTSVRLYGDYLNYGVKGSLDALVESMK